MNELVEKLRSVNWEVVEDFPDHPAFKCVFVDMRPAEFEALLTEAAAALEAARGEVDALRGALEDIRSRSAMNSAMRPNPFALTAELGNIHQIADAAMRKEGRNG